MKLNTVIAQMAFTDHLKRIFIDFVKGMAMVTDGYHAAYAKLGGDTYLPTGGVAVNLDMDRQASIMGPITSADKRVFSACFDARFLFNCVKHLQHELDYEMTPDDLRVRVEIYQAKKADEYILAFSQENCAAIVMAINSEKPFEAWRPFLKEEPAKDATDEQPS